jgi:hypothetical protein
MARRLPNAELRIILDTPHVMSEKPEIFQLVRHFCGATKRPFRVPGRGCRSATGNSACSFG